MCIIGLPRMRGDRPGASCVITYSIVATPHARGSTLEIILRAAPAAGYPACAGIDPTMQPTRPLCSRLPRMRGDRPGYPTEMGHDPKATPHARGSTPCRSYLPIPPKGYPACAGIDLWPAKRCLSRSWLPRMRGDRPFGGRIPHGGGEATPHARGSTCWASQWCEDIAGYPACAGIDPLRALLSLSPLRLPRMRGDRPHIGFRWSHDSSATPHARGSTSPCIRSLLQLSGYPACAGIDRWCLGIPGLSAGLPRMRGDRPS